MRRYHCEIACEVVTNFFRVLSNISNFAQREEQVKYRQMFLETTTKAL